MLAASGVNGQALQVNEAGRLEAIQDGLGRLLALLGAPVQELGKVDELWVRGVSPVSTTTPSWRCLLG